MLTAVQNPADNGHTAAPCAENSSEDMDTEQNQTREKPKSRLVITKLVLTNFKSYAGRQEVGPFHKSFSAVVGPNGSGKSNVIDAMLFVFGYRAAKMRQAKLSELIHSSQKHLNLESCTVDVHFNEIIDLPGPDAFEVVPNSDLVVSRTAFRNNSSKYNINNRTSNYTQVTTLLRDRGIDLDHKRFLILQGEVESISQMKPKAQTEHEDGLLEYLEDIIGTSKYKGDIEEQSKELEKMNEERGGKLERVKIVEKEKQSLESKRNEALAYIRSENELTRKKSALYQRYILDCEDNISSTTQAMEEFSAKLAREQEKHSTIKGEVVAVENEYKSTLKEYESISKNVNEVMKELAKFDREDVQLQEQKKHLKIKHKKVIKQLQKDDHFQSENNTWIQNHNDELLKRQKEVEEMTRSLEREEKELEVIRESLRGKTEVFSAQIEEKQKELAPWSEKINAKQSEIDVAQSEYDVLREKTTAGQRAVEEAEENIRSLRQAQKEKITLLNEIREQKLLVEKEIEQLKKESKTTSERDEKLRLKVNNARQKAEESKMSLQAAQSRGKVLTALLRLRDSGRIKGIYGRLGSLGVIHEDYDVAISTACPQLDNIVVDNVTTGQTCIEYLRRNNLGRASFILLEQLPNYTLDRIETPDNVPRLFDLVKPKDPILAPAFYHVLKDTLVANDITQANKIAYGRQRWRVVTMEGQLIDKSGAMTGGGTKVFRGAMSSRLVADDVQPENVAILEKEREVSESELKAFQENMKKMELQLAEKCKELPKFGLSLTKLEMDLKAIEKQLKDSERRIVDIRSQNQPDARDLARMDDLQKEITKNTKGLATLKASCAGIEDEIRVLQNKILEVGGVRLRSQKSKVDGISQQIDLLNDQITKTQVAKNKAEKDIAKINDAIKKGETEAASLKGQLELLEENIEKMTMEAVAVRAKCDEASELANEKKQELEEMKRRLDEKTEIINKIRAVEVEIKNQLEDSTRNLNDNTKKANHWRNELSALELQPVSDDEDEEENNELRTYDEGDLRRMETKDLTATIAILEAKLKAAKPNLQVLVEYKQREAEYIERVRDLEEITGRRDAVKKQYDGLRKRRLDEFMQGFTAISQKLKEMYQMITLGGNAELELVDSLDPFSEGIIFSVMPPKKSWKNISNLSGGEKTLSSLALVFALHHFKPTPLYVMDEIDAALDFRNVSIVANYIKDRTKNAQFIIISLRSNLFELADLLVGIYKTDNQTKSIAINPSKVMALAG